MAASDEVLDLAEKFIERRQEGETPDLNEICGNRPELIKQVADSISKIDRMRSMDEPGEAFLTRPSSASAVAADLEANITFCELRRKAQGGLGTVYRAQDPKLNRSVAIKVLNAHYGGDSQRREQFKVEASYTSQLEHPGVVPIYGIGETAEGQPFYAMPYIEGSDMEDAIAEFHNKHTDQNYSEYDLEFRELLNHFVALCETIAYAHERGILNNDIKPLNIRLGRFGETIVLDWGSALHCRREGPHATPHEKTVVIDELQGREYSTHDITPEYASPELVQMALNKETCAEADVRPTSDIYSLGAVLYKILVGQPAFDRHDLNWKVYVLKGMKDKPSQISSGISKPLEAICLCAMNIDRSVRYQTAKDLAEDVKCYLADQAISVHEESLGGKLTRWMRRHRKMIPLVLMAGVAFIALTTFLALAASSKERERAQRILSQASAAASALATDVERRFSLLDSMTDDEAGIALVYAASEAPEDQQRWNAVNHWLNRRAKRVSQREDLNSYAWFVNLNDGSGTQIARHPQYDDQGDRWKTIGNSYASREYFHGQTPEQRFGPRTRNTQLLSIITERTLSTPFEGTAPKGHQNGPPVLCFSVPIRYQGQILGVLGMAVEVFDIKPEFSKLGDHQQITIVHTMKDDFHGRKSSAGIARGLVLQHGGFMNAQNRFEPVRLDETLLSEFDLNYPRAFLVKDYLDPASKLSSEYQGEWLAGFAPVRLPHRNRAAEQQSRATGWCVILQERP